VLVDGVELGGDSGQPLGDVAEVRTVIRRPLFFPRTRQCLHGPANHRDLGPQILESPRRIACLVDILRQAEQHRGRYFVIGKRDVPGKSNPPLFVSCGTLDEIQTADLNNLPSEQRPTAVHGVDVWGLAETVRDRAKKVGVTLGEPPFFLPATDPLYQQIISTGDALMVSLVDRYNKLQRMPVPLRKPPPEIIKIFEQVIMN